MSYGFHVFKHSNKKLIKHNNIFKIIYIVYILRALGFQ
jgi:hypothetical protein